MFRGATFGADVAAGVTVALVALPLNLALAIASGVPAGVGIVTAVIAGTTAGMLGGSRLAVTGPAAAMVPLVFEIVQRHGVRGLIVATMICGLLQIGLGLARVGRLVQSIPVSVIAGFMSGIGMLILAGQLPRLLGLPAEVKNIGKVVGNRALLGQVHVPSLAIGGAVLVAMLIIPRIDKRIPAALIALSAVTAVAVFMKLDLRVVGTIPRGIPSPALPSFAGVDVIKLLPEALALTALASIESLLSAVGVDAMAKTPRHSSDQELIGQGCANLMSAFFGGLPVTGVIVRSSVAVQSGGKTRLTPVTHSMMLLFAMLVAAPVVGRVPIAALAGLLCFIGLRLIEIKELRKMWKISRFESFVFVSTMAGIVLSDFIDGVMIGLILALVHFAHTQRQLGVVSLATDEEGEIARLLTHNESGERPLVSVVRITGPIFFVSHTALEQLEQRRDLPRYLVFDLFGVPLIDVTGIETLKSLIRTLEERGTKCAIARVSEAVNSRLRRAAVEKLVIGQTFHRSLADTIRYIASQDEEVHLESQTALPPSSSRSPVANPSLASSAIA